MAGAHYGVNRAKKSLMNAKDDCKGLRTITLVTRKWLQRLVMAIKATRETLCRDMSKLVNFT